MGGVDSRRSDCTWIFYRGEIGGCSDILITTDYSPQNKTEGGDGLYVGVAEPVPPVGLGSLFFCS